MSHSLHFYWITSVGIFFLQGIIESNPFGVPIKGLVDSVSLGLRFAKQLGCGTHDVSCVKEKVGLMQN